MTTPAILALEDGTIFEGVSVGANGLSVGEVVFNTAMTGYQEILTDPSYARQLVTLTYPHIGNTGCNDEDDEAAEGVGRGPDRARRAAPAEQLAQTEVAAGVADGAQSSRSPASTRASSRACCATAARRTAADGRRRSTPTRRIEAARKFPGLKGMDLAKVVSTTPPIRGTRAARPGAPATFARASEFHVVAYDFGVKRNILRMLAERGCRRDRGAGADACRRSPGDEARRRVPSNGPGDPEPATTRSTRSANFVGEAAASASASATSCSASRSAQDHEDEVRPPWRQPPGHRPRQRPRDDHPQNHGFCIDEATLPANARCHASLAVRWQQPGNRVRRCAGVLVPGPPGSLARSARHGAAVRPFHRIIAERHEQDPYRRARGRDAVPVDVAFAESACGPARSVPVDAAPRLRPPSAKPARTGRRSIAWPTYWSRRYRWRIFEMASMQPTRTGRCRTTPMPSTRTSWRACAAS